MSDLRSLRLHYFLGYGAVGAIGPFIPEFFRTDRQLNAEQIGAVFAVAQVCVMVSPLVLTLLADRWVKPKILAVGIFLSTAAALSGLGITTGFGAVMLFYALYVFIISALFPSQDGLYFAIQSKRTAGGLSMPPYHRIRALGTIGFIVPSVVLLVVIPPGGSLVPILPTAIAFGALAALNATTLPDPRVPPAVASRSRLPTIDATRMLFSRRNLGFCLAMFLLQMAHASYYTFYPVHLVQSLGVDQRWLGAISTLGVVVEGVMMYAFGWFTGRFGISRLVAVGAAFTALRLAILVYAHDALPAILSNLLHGPIILGTLVAPVVFINRFAGDTFRNSMQGVFLVAITSPARIVGNLLSGRLATIDTRWAFAAGAAAAVIATIIVLTRVRDPAEAPSARQ